MKPIKAGQRTRSVALGAASAAALFALTGCAAIPDLGLAPVIKSVTEFADGQSFSAPATDWPADNWWRVYGDEQLDKLIDTALAGSPDLAQVQARVRQAQAYAQEAGAALGPHLDAT